MAPLVSGLSIEPVIPGLEDSPREAKEILIFFSLAALAAFGIFSGITAPIRNKWLLAAAFLPIFSLPSLPKILVPYGQFNLAHIWVWRPMALSFLYLLAMQTCSKILEPARRKSKVLSCIGSVGAVVSFYVIAQAAGLDQFFSTLPADAIGTPDNPHITGTFGNYTLAGAFLAVTGIVAFYAKAKKRSAVIFAGLIVCGSDLAFFSSVASVASIFILSRPSLKGKILAWASIAGATAIFSAIFLFFAPDAFKKAINLNGRMEHWQSIVSAWEGPLAVEDSRSYKLLGTGQDSYKYLFLRKTPSSGWREAHSEPLEIGLYNGGIVGLIVYFGLFLSFVKRRKSFQETAALAGLLCLFFLSLGTFIFHVEPFKFYAMIFASFLIAE